jgi:hypothetical protein
MSDYLDIHMITRQLTDWYTHREPYTHESNGTTWQGHHITQVPPLITQLTDAAPADTNKAGGKAGSRPPTSLDAIDTYIHIDLESARWVRNLGEDDPGDTIACVRKVHALAASAHFCGSNKATTDPKTRKVTCCTVHDIERDIRRWWTMARLVSGWDTAAWAPNNTCPVCSKRRSLRIRADDRTAMCTNCRETWTESTVGLLAEHIRAENGESGHLSGDVA